MLQMWYNRGTRDKNKGNKTMARDFETAVVRCKLNWVCFNSLNTKSNKFQAECCNLSDADQKKLADIGLGERVRTRDDKPEYGTFITVKSNMKDEEYRNDENDLRWFNVTYADRMPVDLTKIGNETEALVKVSAIPYDNKFGKGIKADLTAVVVTKLVEYEGGENNDDLYEAAGNLPEQSDDTASDGWDDAASDAV